MAKFAILRTGKLKSAASVRGMLKHNFRTIKTPNTNSGLSHLNVHWQAQGVDDGMRRYRDRMPDKIRKNGVHAIDYMITTSPEADQHTNEQCLLEGYRWLLEKHGEENIVMASMHKDEKTPHLHCVVVPIDEKGKLNARHFLGGTRHRMSDLQDEFYARVQARGLDLDRGIRGSKAKHQTVSAWHAKQQKILNEDYKSTKFEVEDSLKPKKKGLLFKESKHEASMRVINELYKTTVNQKEALRERGTTLRKLDRQTEKLKTDALKYQQLTREIYHGETESLQELTTELEKSQERIKESEAEKARKRLKREKSRDLGWER